MPRSDKLKAAVVAKKKAMAVADEFGNEKSDVDLSVAKEKSPGGMGISKDPLGFKKDKLTRAKKVEEEEEEDEDFEEEQD